MPQGSVYFKQLGKLPAVHKFSHVSCNCARTVILNPLLSLRLLIMSSSGGAKAAKMKYVGCKLSQVKWRPQLPGCLECSDTLATGSKSHTEVKSMSVWRLSIHHSLQNHVTFWRFPPPHEEMEGDTWLGEDGPTVMEPSLLCSVKTCSSVLALSFLDPVRIAASLCNGTVQLFTTHPSAAVRLVAPNACSLFLLSLQSGREAQRWPGLHTGPCATLSSAASLIFTGGEDGRINVLKVGEEDPVRTIGNWLSVPAQALYQRAVTQSRPTAASFQPCTTATPHSSSSPQTSCSS